MSRCLVLLFWHPGKIHTGWETDLQPSASSSMQFLLTMLRFHSSSLKLGCMVYFYSVLSQICVHIHGVAGVEDVLGRYLTSILCPLPSPSLFEATEVVIFLAARIDKTSSKWVPSCKLQWLLAWPSRQKLPFSLFLSWRAGLTFLFVFFLFSMLLLLKMSVAS